MCERLGTPLSTSLRTFGATSPAQLAFLEGVWAVKSSSPRARPLHAPLLAVTHVKRPPDRAMRIPLLARLSVENGAREGADGALAGLGRGTRTDGADSPG